MENGQIFENSAWIWAENNQRKNDRVYFRKRFRVDSLPAKALLCVGCETKYWLFVNGRLAVFDGGLFRESLPGYGYYDVTDIAPYLKKGENEIIFHVWFFGNGGRNNTAIGCAGLIFACEEIALFSGSDTVVERARGYYDTSERNPAYLYGGYNVAFDGRKEIFSLCPVIKAGKDAVVVGHYGDAPWGKLLLRPVPPLFFTDIQTAAYERRGKKVTVLLPYAMQFTPYLKVRAEGGEKIFIQSDRYLVHGGPGGTQDLYAGHRAEYVCTAGEQEFESLDWIFGEKIEFTVPETVEIVALGWRESGYASKVIGKFFCDDARVNRLAEKCVRTLKVCMRENFMDCPDRERGQWIGDVSVQAPQVMYLLDDNGRLLLKKAIFDFIRLRKGDVLVGNVPGDHFSELPAQSLNAISERGMVAEYYAATGEKEVLALCFEPAVAYLKLWQTDKDGMLLPRRGDWRWFDHLYNIDEEVLEHCWYYSALRFASFMAKELKDSRFDAFLSARMGAIEKNFAARYWNGKYYTSGKCADDRANAMAVLSGLCPKENFEAVRELLTSVFGCSPYMEYYVLCALCEMGYKEQAFRRMMSRYEPLIDNENTTLWEDFFNLGTMNHAWTGGPITILFRHFAGVKSDLSVRDTGIAPFRRIECCFRRNGETVSVVKEE